MVSDQPNNPQNTTFRFEIYPFGSGFLKVDTLVQVFQACGVDLSGGRTSHNNRTGD